MYRINHSRILKLPTADLIARGFQNLAERIVSEMSLILHIARERLNVLGFHITSQPEVPLPYEHALYAAIEKRCPDNTLPEYNAKIRKLVSFALAYPVRS